MSRSTLLLLPCFLLLVQISKGQSDTTTNLHLNKKKSYSRYSHEFFLSGGYNKCRHEFFDMGIRYYHWTNDGQQILAFKGPAAGCEIALNESEHLYIPYIGWQGQAFFLGYGIRAEYAFNNNKQSYGFTPELGFSLFEMLRITGGYRFAFNNDPMKLSGARFSIIAAFPLSFLKKDED